MQAVNLVATQQGNNQGQGGGTGQLQPSTSKSAVGQSHTLAHSTQLPYSAGDLYTVTISSDHNGGEVPENLQVQHGGVKFESNCQNQVIYQPQQTYTEYGQPGLYTSVSTSYYDASGGAAQGQIVTHGGDSYLIQGGFMDGEGPGLAHTIRASPATVQWLVDNYETAEGVSLPRSTLYYHYLQHCEDQKLDPMNPASFGKLIRSVFMGLRTRRLGTRGNSQYHYYGIRIKSMSALQHFTGESMIMSRQHAIQQAKRKFDAQQNDCSSNATPDSSPASQPSTSHTAPTAQQQQQQQHQQFLGDTVGAVPNFGIVDVATDQLAAVGLNVDHLRVFEMLYKDHCEAFLEIIINLQFPLIETLWMSFWRTSQGDPESDDMEHRLPKDKLYTLCDLSAVRQYIRHTDYVFYQSLVKVLIPDVLRPIPSMLTQAIRNFGKSLEGWLRNAIVGVPEELVKIKIGAVSAFAQILRRYTSLNHLAQAARAVLQNSTQISQMLTDINKVDFTNVQEQASWVCQCDDGIVHQLEQDFKRTLQQQTSLEQWAAWLEGVVNQALSAHESSPNFAKAARQFLLKWSFYSSMVIRDLTLRSAASFGSFHLIRLLYDEYMFYLVEHKVAVATGETSIAIMGDVRESIDLEDELSSPVVRSSGAITSTVTSASFAPPPGSATPSSSSSSSSRLIPTSSGLSSHPPPSSVVSSQPPQPSRVVPQLLITTALTSNQTSTSGLVASTSFQTTAGNFSVGTTPASLGRNIVRLPMATVVTSASPHRVALIANHSMPQSTRTIVVMPASSVSRSTVGDVGMSGPQPVKLARYE